MSEPLSKIPDGMRYFFGPAAQRRRHIENTVMSVFDGWSYEEISTPSVYFYALFERGMGATEARRAFRFTDTDGSLLALRPDVTSSVARAAATLHASRERPLRLCYAANVFLQHTRSPAQWRRESRQLGCELIGADAIEADLEMLVMLPEILGQLGLRDYCITLNTVELFNGVAHGLSLNAADRAEMQRLIDIKDAAELEKFLAPHAPAREVAAFAEMTQLAGKRSVLDQARGVITNARSVAAVDHLDHVWSVLESLGLTDFFDIDLGDVSGLDYYTGLNFKIYLDGAGERAGRGGRYDELIASFSRREPAVGFVLDLDVISDVLANRPPPSTKEKPAAASIEAGDVASLFLAAKQRRKNGERVQVRFPSAP
jgi:ATP phosphoribosyltransferase regulatory subunit